MKLYSRVFETVDLDAVRHNMEAMRSNLAEGTKMIGVIKTDGYGHGAVPIAIAIDPFVWGYGVATVEEGITLRKHGIEKPILVLGVVPDSGYDQLIEYGIASTVFQYQRALKLSDAAGKAGKKAIIHLAVDTGMSRIGFLVNESSIDEAVKISHLPGIELEGIFTHFARADEEDKEATRKQIESFEGFIQRLSERGIQIPMLHCSNSAGILDIPSANFHAVRAGIAMYGLYPSNQVDRETVRLKPVMELKSIVSYVKTIAAGTPVSYGGTFVAEKDMIVATIPVGYGDGYPRGLSGKGEVLIRGQRAKILGRVCMDQFMVDVTEIKGIQEDDEVVLIGRQGEEEITVEDMADTYGGFHYEIICDIGKRIPRVYIQGGRVVGTKDYFDDNYSGF